MGIILQNISQTMEVLILATCLTLTLGGHEGGDIPTRLTNAGADTLVDLVTLAGLGDTLAGEGPFTVFAPTNQAFAKLPASLVNTLTGDTELLKQGVITVNGAQVVYRDQVASNGVIHFVSDVLYPFTPEKTIAEVASADPRFSTLVDVLTKADLASVLSTPGPFTVFAPTNDAFAKVPADALESLLLDNEALTKVC